MAYDPREIRERRIEWIQQANQYWLEKESERRERKRQFEQERMMFFQIGQQGKPQEQDKAANPQVSPIKNSETNNTLSGLGKVGNVLISIINKGKELFQ